MDYYGEFDMNQPLISGPEPPYEEVVIKASGSGFDNLSKESQPAPPNFDALIAFSPQTQLADSFAPTAFSPAIATTQLPQQLSTSNAPVAPAPNSRRHKPTGHRQGVTPDDLLPEDAPTQPRRYMGPSATSKKEIPATFARKRARSVAFGEDDEVFELPPNPTEQQLIEAKRRQNTVAARRSRKRKLEQHANLLASRDEERFFKQRWELRARDLMRLLQEKGIHVPDFPPDEPKYADAC
ncbi:hypothetical protein CPC08DRAFT_704913 [Agrocybe pediades]|nr:hypothetical protein CPC08DRAFT_704913 [Agrocybe pediades]